MKNAEIQIVSNDAGEPTAVTVPMELWREIESGWDCWLRGSVWGDSLEAVVEKLR